MKGSSVSSKLGMPDNMTMGKTMVDAVKQGAKADNKPSGGSMQMSPSMRHRKGCY
jgi:hypothetical protein